MSAFEEKQPSSQKRQKKRTLSIHQRNDNKRAVPDATKRAMRACHLFGSILKTHFNDGICELIDTNSYDYPRFTTDILDNLLLVGDIPRDILLGTPVDVVDITFNLRELTKIHLNHLTKYHSKKEQQGNDVHCRYFEHYLNKFEQQKYRDDIKEKEEKEANNNNNNNYNDNDNDNDMIKFHNHSYIFNAQYFVDILETSYNLQYALTIKNKEKHGLILVEIDRNIKHYGYDLKGVKIKFTDTFDENQVLSVQQQQQNELMERELVKSYGYDPADSQNPKKPQKQRWKSITLVPKGMDYTAEFDDEYKPLEIQVYGTRIKDKLLTYDFSINTAIIPLSSVTEFFDDGDGNGKERNIAIWFWEYIVENGISECDAIHDITTDRILRVPQPGQEKYIIDLHPMTYHFWRTVELMIRLPNFYMDDNLIEAHIDHYQDWLNVEYFQNEDNRREFVNKFVNLVVNYCYDTKDLRAMLQVLEELDFNEVFSELLEEDKSLCLELQAAIKAKDYEELTIITFVSYGYPFKLTAGMGMNDSDNYDNYKHDGNDRMLQLETENKALKQKLNYMEQTQFDENQRLKQEIKDLKQSKIDLVVNCNKAIDECRSYLSLQGN